MSAALPPVSVIVPTYNRGMLLADTIEHLLKNDYPGRFELIVVDQTANYEPEVAQRLDTLRRTHAYEHLQLPVANLPLARNVGMRRSSGEVIVFCDDDVETEPGFVAAHARCYDDASVGAVGGRVITEGYTPPTGATPPPGRLGAHRPLQGHFYKEEPCEIEWGMGCNMSFRRTALEDINGFDERYTGVAFHEDVDAFVRVRRAGWRAVFAPEAKLVHLKSSTGGCRSDAENLSRDRSKARSHALISTSIHPPRWSDAPQLFKRGIQTALHGATVHGKAAPDQPPSLPGGNVWSNRFSLKKEAAFAQILAGYFGGVSARIFRRPDKLSRALAARPDGGCTPYAFEPLSTGSSTASQDRSRTDAPPR